jgi:hypothetical protein
MSQFRNATLGVLALVCLASSASHAGNSLQGSFADFYVGPAKSSGASNGIGGLLCPSTAHCSFTRAGVVPAGESNWAIIVETTVPNQVISVDLLLWAAEACQPDPLTPDADTGFQTLTLAMAGRHIIYFPGSEAITPAGTTFSQVWFVGTDTQPLACGGSFCVNSISGQPTPAPFDCDAP